MKRATSKKPLLQAVLPQSDLQVAAEVEIPYEAYTVTAESVLSGDEIVLFQRLHPDVLDVRFRSRKQAEWALRIHLPFLKEACRQTPRNLLNTLLNDGHRVEEELRITLDERRATFLKRMGNRRLDSRKGEAPLEPPDYSRALADCLTFRVWLYGTSLPQTEKGKKRMAVAKIDRKVPKYLRGMELMSDASLVRSIWLQTGQCAFTDGERLILKFCEGQIREDGEDNFAFYDSVQRAAYELLARQVHVRERVLLLDDIPKFKKALREQPMLSGLVMAVRPRGVKPKKVVREGQLELFEQNRPFVTGGDFLWGQQELFERKQAELFDLGAPWFF